jgi:hypothetical protein
VGTAPLAHDFHVANAIHPGRLGHANAATMLGVYSHFVGATDQDGARLLGALRDTSS